jgi:hypothetical protein
MEDGERREEEGDSSLSWEKDERGSRKEIIHYKMGDGGRRKEEGDSSLR